MRYLDEIRNVLKRYKELFMQTSRDIQPRDILSKIVNELEKRKKLGIEENAFVPNVYAIYLSPVDYEELSPFLSGIKDQLKNKLMDRVRKYGYRLLSSSVYIELREDPALEKNQIVVESTFVKEKASPHKTEKDKVVHFDKAVSQEQETLKKDEPLSHDKRTGMTKVIEDKKTKIIDATKLTLEILKGDKKGENISLKEGEYTFGRGKDAVILVRDTEDTISRVHFKVTVKDGRINIKDLNSLNGTKVNDIDIEEAELKRGDTITAGKVLLKVA